MERLSETQAKRQKLLEELQALDRQMVATTATATTATATTAAAAGGATTTGGPSTYYSSQGMGAHGVVAESVLQGTVGGIPLQQQQSLHQQILQQQQNLKEVAQVLYGTSYIPVTALQGNIQNPNTITIHPTGPSAIQSLATPIDRSRLYTIQQQQQQQQHQQQQQQQQQQRQQQQRQNEQQTLSKQQQRQQQQQQQQQRPDEEQRSRKRRTQINANLNNISPAFEQQLFEVLEQEQKRKRPDQTVNEPIASLEEPRATGVAAGAIMDLQRYPISERRVLTKEPELIELKPDLAGVPLSKRREIGREDREALLAARKIRNRESASRSRARTAVYVKDLEKEVVKLKEDVEKLRADHEQLRRDFEGRNPPSSIGQQEQSDPRVPRKKQMKEELQYTKVKKDSFGREAMTSQDDEPFTSENRSSDPVKVVGHVCAQRSSPEKETNIGPLHQSMLPKDNEGPK